MEVMIIGGGAAGLMAAVTAARAGARVTVLEHQSACGKKLLATGNGRCNLTNMKIAPDAYRSHAPEVVSQVLRRFTVKDTLDFFRGLGLYTRRLDLSIQYAGADRSACTSGRSRAFGYTFTDTDDDPEDLETKQMEIAYLCGDL